MYPNRQLAALRDRRTILQAKIAVRRWETAATGLRLARPLAFIDRVAGFWHNLSPALKGIGIPLALFVWKKVRERKGKGTATATGGLKLAVLFETLPLVFRGIAAIRHSRAQRKRGVPVC